MKFLLRSSHSSFGSSSKRSAALSAKSNEPGRLGFHERSRFGRSSGQSFSQCPAAQAMAFTVGASSSVGPVQRRSASNHKASVWVAQVPNKKERYVRLSKLQDFEGGSPSSTKNLLLQGLCDGMCQQRPKTPLSTGELNLKTIYYIPVGRPMCCPGLYMGTTPPGAWSCRQISHDAPSHPAAHARAPYFRHLPKLLRVPHFGERFNVLLR